MKKITLWTALLFASLAFAQEISIVDRPMDSGNLGLGNAQVDDSTGVYIADSFTISEGFGLNSITVHGFLSNQSSSIKNFNFIIYADNQGSPGDGIHPGISGEGVIELKEISAENYSVDGTGTIKSVTIDIVGANGGEAPALVAGTYWLACYPAIESSPTGSGWWSWLMSFVSAPMIPLQIDPQNLSGLGDTNWRNAPVPSSFAWSMRGTSTLGLQKNEMAQISLYPNPAKELVTLKIPSNREVTAVSLHNILGKKMHVDLANDQINVAHLSKGLYLLSLETTTGSWTQKLVIE